MNIQTIKTNGFVLAGLANIGGVLTFSLGFSNQGISQAFPQVMSAYGLLMIIVWGLAYLAVAKHYQHVRLLVGVFAIEKLAYVASWLWWMSHYADTLPTLWQADWLTASFMLIYGLNDVLFMLFFMWVFLSHSKES